jgi:hypothetical protein
MEKHMIDVIKEMMPNGNVYGYSSSDNNKENIIDICLKKISNDFVKLSPIKNRPTSDKTESLFSRFSNSSKRNGSLYSKLNLDDNELIFKLDQSIKVKDDLLDDLDTGLSDNQTKLILPKEMLSKLDLFLNDIKVGSTGNKILPLLIVIGKQGYGKGKVIEYAIEQLGINKSNVFLGDGRRKKNKDLSVRIYSDVAEFQDAVNRKEPNVLLCLKMIPKKRSFFDMDTSDALDFVDAYYNIQLKLDDSVYSEESVINDLIVEFCKKYDYKDDKKISSKEFVDKRIRVTPKLMDGTFNRAKTRAELLGVELNYDILIGSLTAMVSDSDKTELCLITKPTKKIKDLVLTPNVFQQIETIFYSAKGLNKIKYEFQKNLRGSSSRIVALFTGLPGTGKSLCAEVLAGELGKDLWTVDFGQVFDKYVGETEKHLTEIFNQAKIAKVVLRIDEADSLISTRSAEDKGWEVTQKNHMLNLIENYEGVVILTTNRGLNIDAAFSRRIDFKIEFELPTHTEMREIITTLLYPDAPLSDDFDLTQVLNNIKPMSGGFIRLGIERCLLNMMRDNKEIITSSDLNKALLAIQSENKLIDGNKRSIGFAD